MAGSVEYIQPSFAGGEIAPDARGRVDSPAYRFGLGFSENWLHKPRGSLLRRAGSMFAGGPYTSGNRLVPFRTSSGDYVIDVTDGFAIQVYSQATGALVAIEPNLITNGHFDSDLTGWTTVGGNVAWDLEALRLQFNVALGRVSQVIAVTPGQTYRLRLRSRTTGATGAVRVYFDGVLQSLGTLSMAWKTFTWDWVPAGATSTIEIEGNTVGAQYVYVDDVTAIRVGASVNSLAAPWSTQIADLQYGAELVKNRVVFVHGAVQPHVVVFTAPATWEIYPATFISKPAEWGTENWPSAIEVGFQGRQWFAGTPNEPTTIWGSRSGKAFDFTVGVNPDDAVSWVASTKGPIRWMRGQKVLLVGTELGELSITGASNGALITPSSVDIREESSFGSAPVQGHHIGDQVLFVTRDRRRIRGLSYSLQDNAWISRALTFLAEHLTEGKIKELHFTYSPLPVLMAVMQDGTVVGCTHDRAEEVLAWWRVNIGATIYSAAIAEGTSGAEIWVTTSRAVGTPTIERIPLHEAAGSLGVRAPGGYVFEGNVVPPSTAAGASFNLACSNADWVPPDVGQVITFVGGGRVQVTAIVSGAVATVLILQDLSAGTITKLQAGTMSAYDFYTGFPGVSYLDSAKVGVVAADGSCSGLDHLNGLAVGVIVDGAVSPIDGQVVVAGKVTGIDVALAGKLMVVGLPYTAKAITLPPEGGNPKGTSQRSQKRFADLFLRVNNSALPKVDGYRSPDRSPASPMDAGEPLTTGDIGPFETDWGSGEVTIEQDLPFRTEVLALFGKLEQQET